MDEIFDGSHDFENVYPEFGQRKMIESQRKILQDLLEQLEEKQVEELRISPTGEIQREETNNSATETISNKRGKTKVVSMDELPQEGELQNMLFGKPASYSIDEEAPKQKPPIEFQTGRRVSDGAIFHRLQFNRFPWEFVFGFCVLTLAIAMLYWRIRKLTGILDRRRIAFARIRREQNMDEDQTSLRQMIRSEVTNALQSQHRIRV